MRRSNAYLYLFILAAIMAILLIPFSFTMAIRSVCVGFLTLFSRDSSSYQTYECQELLLQNNHLKEQIEELSSLLQAQKLTGEQSLLLKNLSYDKKDEEEAGELRRESLLAKVVYRDPSCWSSFLWIAVGEKDNKKCGKKIVAKDSPVVWGDCLVGVVEEVKGNRSLIRLITDSSLVTSVYSAKDDLELKEDRFNESFLLAELMGSSEPLWRSLGSKIKGVGFSCQYSDEANKKTDNIQRSNIEKGDHLKTTGLDGLFPANLNVAKVTKVEPVQEGACFYNLEAEVAFLDLNRLTYVSVLPPLAPPLSE